MSHKIDPIYEISYPGDDQWASVLQCRPDRGPTSRQLIIAEWARSLEANVLVTESEYIDRTYLDGYDTNHSKSFSSQKRRCKRHLFFHLSSKDLSRLKAELAGPHARIGAIDFLAECCDRMSGKSRARLLAAVVVRPISKCLGRSYFTIRGIEGSACIRSEHPSFITMNKEINIAGRSFVITDCIPYISQDGYSSACSSVATWLALELLTQGDDWSFSPASITQAAIAIRPDQGFYERGLVVEQIVVALREHGVRPLIAVPKGRETWKSFLGWLLDSSVPVVVGMLCLDDGEHHAVAVVGSAGYAPGHGDPSPWWHIGQKRFLCIDDNVGPFAELEFLDGDKRAYLELVHGRIIKEARLDGSSLVKVTSLDDEYYALVESVVAGIPHSIEPICQDITREAPETALRAASIMFRDHRAYYKRDHRAYYRKAHGKKWGARLHSLLGDFMPLFGRDVSTGDTADLCAFAIRVLVELEKRKSRILPRSMPVAEKQEFYELISFFLYTSPEVLSPELDEAWFQSIYFVRPRLVQSVEYKHWLSQRRTDEEFQIVNQEFRNLPMPQFVYAAEIIRKYSIHRTRWSRDNGAVLHGEVLCDPSRSEPHILGGWFECALYLPEDPREGPNEFRGIYDRMLQMKSVPLGFAAKSPMVAAEY